jgi:hypothetical protein
MSASRFFTGDGEGYIEFIVGNPHSPLVTPARYEKPLPKKLSKKGWAGVDDGWGMFSAEMAVRGDPRVVNHRHPRLEALGIRDHKEAVATRMLQALHEGDATYFDGLANTLRKFEEMKGDPTPPQRLQDVVLAIRRAAIACDGVPTQRDVFDYWAPGRGSRTKEAAEASAAGLWKKFREDKLVPLGFQWLPTQNPGRPKNSP